MGLAGKYSIVNAGFMNVLPMVTMGFGDGSVVISNCDSVSAPIQFGLNTVAQYQMAQNCTPYCGIDYGAIAQQAHNIAQNIWNNVIGKFDRDNAQSLANQVGSQIITNTRNLDKYLDSADYTSEEKEKIKEFKEKIAEQEKIYKEIIGNTSITDSERANRLRQVADKLREISDEAGKYIGEIDAAKQAAKEADDKAKEADDKSKQDGNGDGNGDGSTVNGNGDGNGDGSTVNGDNNGNSNGGDDGDSGDGGDGDESGNGSVGGDELSDTEKAKLEESVANVIRTNTEDFALAVDGWTSGTDNEKFEGVLKYVAASATDNYVTYGEYIVKLMAEWDKSQASKFGGESFAHVFMDDASHEQKKKFGRDMLRGLRGLAQLHNCEAQLKSDFDYIDKELTSWFINEDDTAAAFDRIYKVLKEKMNAQQSQQSQQQSNSNQNNNK